MSFRFRRRSTGNPNASSSLSAIALATLSALSVSACSSGDEDEDQDDQIVGIQLYSPQNLPSNFTPPVPDSLQPDASTETDSGIDLGLATGRRHILDDGGEPPPTANGYIQLQAIIDGMRTRKRDVALNFVMADAIFDDLLTSCAGQTTRRMRRATIINS